MIIRIKINPIDENVKMSTTAPKNKDKDVTKGGHEHLPIDVHLPSCRFHGRHATYHQISDLSYICNVE